MKLFMRIFWGLLFIAAAVILILSGINVIPLQFELTSRIIILTVLGAVSIHGLLKLEWFTVFIPLAIATKLAISYGFLAVEASWWMVFGIAGLLIIGFSILFPRGMIKKNCRKNFRFDGKNKGSKDEEENPSSSTVFGGSTKYFTSKNLKTINADCVFGGTEIYLTEADLHEGHAHLELSVVFGGVSVYVPKTWEIKNDTSLVMGGVTFEGNAAESSSKNKRVLTISGDVVFSGVTIIYV